MFQLEDNAKLSGGGFKMAKKNKLKNKDGYRPSAPVSCSTPVTFSEAWWKIIEANRIEKAHKFGPNADVLSAISARAMVIDALKWFKLKA